MVKLQEKFAALANREAPAMYDHGPGMGHHNLAEELCYQMGR